MLEVILGDKLKPDTLENYKYAFQSFMEVIGDVYIDTITVKEVSTWKENATRFVRKKNEKGDWIRENTGKLLSKTTISIYGRGFKAAWGLAIQHGYADQNPFLIAWPSTEETRRKNACMSSEEVERFLNGAMENKNPRLGVFFQMSAYTGLRRGELLRIQGKHINLEKMELAIYITKKRLKTEWIKVPLSKRLYNILKDVKLEPEDYLFQTRAWSHKDVSKPWSKTYVTKAFRRIADQVGLSKSYSLHSFRHSFVTQMHKNGVRTQAIQRLIGHSSPEITILEYDHTDALDFRQAVDDLDYGTSPENEA